VEFALNEGELAGEDVAVDVVEQVEGEQEQECPQSRVQERAAGWG
jgi:hypothetical protein